MSSDEAEVDQYEENLFADEAEVSGSDRERSGNERSGDEATRAKSGDDENKDKSIFSSQTAIFAEILFRVLTYLSDSKVAVCN